MELPKNELEKLVEKYQRKADKAGMNYQETGEHRFLAAKESAEDMADALLMALDAQEDHDELGMLKAHISDLAYRAYTYQLDDQKLRDELVGFADVWGLISMDHKTYMSRKEEHRKALCTD